MLKVIHMLIKACFVTVVLFNCCRGTDMSVIELKLLFLNDCLLAGFLLHQGENCTGTKTKTKYLLLIVVTW